jgi:MFS transporter, CP family, cyanate transporter
MSRPSSSVIALWLAGVLAAAQLGKITGLAPALRGVFGLSLPALGWLISLLEVGGALFGFAAGLVLGRVGARRMMLAGLALLAASGLAEGLTRLVGVLFLARAVEGIGYLLVVISAPTMIVARTRAGSERDAAMALWSTFVPVGVGCGTAITGFAEAWFGARVTLLGWALAGLVLLVVLLVVLGGRAGPAPARRGGALPARRGGALPAPGAWLLCLGFGCYTLFLCALTGLLPLFLFDRHATAIATGSVIAGGVALSALPGTALSLALLRQGVMTRARSRVLAAILLGAGLVAPLIFRAGGVVGCAMLAGVFLLLAGMARTLIFTRLPALSGGQSPEDPRFASAQGLLTQCGAGGALLGPPLGARLVQAHGWGVLGVLIGLMAVVLLACLLGAERHWRWPVRG